MLERDFRLQPNETAGSGLLWNSNQQKTSRFKRGKRHVSGIFEPQKRSTELTDSVSASILRRDRSGRSVPGSCPIRNAYPTKDRNAEGREKIPVSAHLCQSVFRSSDSSEPYSDSPRVKSDFVSPSVTKPFSPSLLSIRVRFSFLPFFRFGLELDS